MPSRAETDVEEPSGLESQEEAMNQVSAQAANAIKICSVALKTVLWGVGVKNWVLYLGEQTKRKQKEARASQISGHYPGQVLKNVAGPKLHMPSAAMAQGQFACTRGRQPG